MKTTKDVDVVGVVAAVRIRQGALIGAARALIAAIVTVEVMIAQVVECR